VAGTPVPPFLSRDGQDIVHENLEQKYLNANKIIEIQKSLKAHSDHAAFHAAIAAAESKPVSKYEIRRFRFRFVLSCR
jgi:hypothetical protein